MSSLSATLPVPRPVSLMPVPVALPVTPPIAPALKAEAAQTIAPGWLTFQDLSGVAPADVLVVLAHPDDELFLSGRLAELAHAGHSVQVVYVTNGKAGRDISGLALQGDRLGVTREREAVRALQVLGVQRSPLFLDFMDGQTGAYPEALAEQLRAVLMQIRPGELLMYNAHDGITGHPDHIIVAQTLQRVIDTISQGATPRDRQDRQRILPLLQTQNVLQAALPQSAQPYFTSPFSQDPSWSCVRYEPDHLISQRIVLSPAVQERKARSMGQHRTQYRPADVAKMSRFITTFPVESYIRYQPARSPSRSLVVNPFNTGLPAQPGLSAVTAAQLPVPSPQRQLTA